MSFLFALIVTAILYFAWIASNCPGGDVCAIAEGMAPYLAVVVFLIAWGVGYVVELFLPDGVVDRVNSWINPRKK
jgi:hypothetical protein